MMDLMPNLACYAYQSTIYIQNDCVRKSLIQSYFLLIENHFAFLWVPFPNEIGNFFIHDCVKEVTVGAYDVKSKKQPKLYLYLWNNCVHLCFTDDLKFGRFIPFIMRDV